MEMDFADAGGVGVAVCGELLGQLDEGNGVFAWFWSDGSAGYAGEVDG